MSVLTPTVGQATRRSLFWIGAAIFLLLAAIGVLLLTGAAQDTEALSPRSPTPDGTLALAEVLRQEGVEVQVTDTLEETEAAASGEGGTTVLLHDRDDLLTTAQRTRLLSLADHLIVLAPSFRALQDLSPGVGSAGVPDENTLPADCTVAAAAAAGEISPGGTSYRTDDPTAEVCFRSDPDGAEDAYSLVEVETAGTTVSVVGATSALTNAEIVDHGNAAFALTLLGAHGTLVWYLPSIADVAGTVDPAALTPGWVTPTLLLLTLTTIAAAVWKGRRFGPLLVENLPVVVRASETMEGRARLYQRGSARLRALDALRIGAATRLATRCGLPKSASVDDVVLAVASRLNRDPRILRNLLVDDVPATDHQLVHLSDDLLRLEADLTAATRP